MNAAVDDPTRPREPVRLGLLGLDASHAVALTHLVNGPPGARTLAGRARVVSAWPGPVSTDFAPSHGRAAGITATMRDELGIPIVNAPTDLLDAVDALVITAADPRIHPAVFAEVASGGKPTAIVKILSADAASAQEMVDLAGRIPVPLLAASPHRFGLTRNAAVAEAIAGGGVRGADVQGRMPEEPPVPAAFWYGAHLIDLLYATLGPGCTTVTTIAPGPGMDQIIAGVWDDGRVGVIRGMREWPRRWKVDLHRDDGSTTSADPTADGKPLLEGLVQELVQMTLTGRSSVQPAEMVEVVRFAEAAERSRLTGTEISLAAGRGLSTATPERSG